MNIIYIMTYDCNLRCKYCDVYKMKKNINKKVIDDSFRLLKDNKIDITSIKFFGGEPLIMKDEVKYIIENIEDKGTVKFYLTTNSLLINDDFINFSKTINLNLTFSIDGKIGINGDNRITQQGKQIGDEVAEKVKKYGEYIKINQVITPNNSKYFFENFEYIYGLGIRKFNFLPAYYIPWTKKSLQELKIGFDKILTYVRIGNTFDLVNLENFSEMSFFNKGIVIDTDGKIYGTNLILNKKFEKYKNDLLIGNTFDKSLNISIIGDNYLKKIDEILKKEYSLEIIKSVEYIDLILNNFCNEF